jgi:opacity protein-like surface antigen
MQRGRTLKFAIGFTLAAAAISAVASSAPNMGYYVYSSQPGTYQASSNDFDGFYLGVNLGLNPQQVEVNYPAVIGRTDNLHETKLDLLGGFYGGYGWVISKFYLGLEVNGRYNFSGNEYTQTIGTGSTELTYNNFKQTWSGGGSVLLGGVISDNSLLYLIGGFQAAHFKYGAGTSPSGPLPQYKKTKMGFRIGAGVSLQLTNSINADLRYQYERYSKIDAATNGTTPEFKPVNNMITFGISYHFA